MPTTNVIFDTGESFTGSSTDILPSECFRCKKPILPGEPYMKFASIYAIDKLHARLRWWEFHDECVQPLANYLKGCKNEFEELDESPNKQ